MLYSSSYLIPIKTSYSIIPSIVLHNDILMKIFSYYSPNIICQLSKYWYSQRITLAEEAYNHKLKQINNNHGKYTSTQLNDIYDTVLIHENLNIGERSELIPSINDFYQHDYQTISFCCLRRKINKLYNYKSINDKVSPIKSFFKDRQCLMLMLIYFLLIILMSYLLIYTKLEVRYNIDKYVHQYLGNNWNLNEDQFEFLYRFEISDEFIFVSDCVLMPFKSENILDVNKTYDLPFSLINETLSQLLTPNGYYREILKLYNYNQKYYVANFIFRVIGQCNDDDMLITYYVNTAEINYDAFISDWLAIYGIALTVSLLLPIIHILVIYLNNVT